MAFVDTTIDVTVTAGESPKRLDQFLAARDPNFSRSALQRFITEGRVTINGRLVRPSQKVQPGDRIRMEIPRPEPIEVLPEPIPLQILYEDEALVVLDKPAGLVVHPAPGHWTGTLVNALLHHFGSGGSAEGEGRRLSVIGGEERPGLVHRLDKDTSGVMVVAKHDQAHRHLADQFKRHTITRIYEVLVWKRLIPNEGTIELAIGRDWKERKKFSSRTHKPRASATSYQVEEHLDTMATRVLAFPRTGRTHQIRVHLAAVGHPVLGDETYGGRKVIRIDGFEIPRTMLHARTLGFSHPADGRRLEFSVPHPTDFHHVLMSLREAAGRGSPVQSRRPTSP